MRSLKFILLTTVALWPVVAEAQLNNPTPIATSSSVGTVKPDNTSTTVDSNGTLHATGGSGGITQLTGDVAAGPGTGSQGATLATSGVTAGTYGDATHAPAITVDAKGRATSASNVTVTPAIGSVTGLGSGVGAALAIAHDTTGGVCTVGGTGCPSGGGTLTVTDGTTSVTGATTLTLAPGLKVSGTTPNATAGATTPDNAYSANHTVGAADMAAQMSLTGSGTLTIPAISGTVFASGMTSCFANNGSGTWTISSTPTINGLNSTSLPPGAGGCLTSNGTTIDFAQGMSLPTATRLGGLITTALAAHNFATGVSPSTGQLTGAQPAVGDISGLGTGVGTALGNALSAAGGVSSTIASGTSALGTSAISSAACATTVTTSAPNVATTDVISAGFNSDPTGVTGYVPATTGMLTIIPFPSSGNVNFKVCNNTSASITPGAITLNWRVTR